MITKKSYDLALLLSDFIGHGYEKEDVMKLTLQEIDDFYSKNLSKNYNFIETPRMRDFIKNELIAPKTSAFIERTIGFTDEFFDTFINRLQKMAEFIFIPYVDEVNAEMFRGFRDLISIKNQSSYSYGIYHRNKQYDLCYFLDEYSMKEDSCQVPFPSKVKNYKIDGGNFETPVGGISLSASEVCENIDDNGVKGRLYLIVDNIGSVFFGADEAANLVLDLVKAKYPLLADVISKASFYGKRFFRYYKKDDGDVEIVDADFYYNVKYTFNGKNEEESIVLSLSDLFSRDTQSIFEKNVWSKLSIYPSYGGKKKPLVLNEKGESKFDVIMKSDDVKKIYNFINSIPA